MTGDNTSAAVATGSKPLPLLLLLLFRLSRRVEIAARRTPFTSS